MLSDDARGLIDSVAVTLPADRAPSEADILERATKLRLAFPVNDAEFETILRELHSRLRITMDLGQKLVEEDHIPWLAARKASIDPFYWMRYQTWLAQRGWPRPVVASMDQVTDNILDLLGDPNRDGRWRRRGLVVGDVQSGKTAAYTAIACKAADAGYKMIVLLTGSIENLRRQTQERLDEGFVGFDSSDLLARRFDQTRVVGAGRLDQRRRAAVFTSRERDFNRSLVSALGISLENLNEPVLVVLKKNKRILENLENWLSSRNLAVEGQKIDVPLLLIDDEADNASINTNRPGASPTAINRQIRSLMELFTRSTYVGFTATPFANIFIDPETDDDMWREDLFPRDFIYCLDPPTNYVGARALFDDEPALPDALQAIEDAQDVIPPRHKPDFQVTELPDSLLEALRTFLLSVTIRDLRGEGPTHRSMLVNVSRFTSVQNQVEGLLNQQLRELQQDIRNFAGLPPHEAVFNRTIADLRATWQRQYAALNHEGRPFAWEAIQAALQASCLPIETRAVNQRTGAASLDYRPYRDTGLRVVAVGGNSLSRGLTLEGLTVSYFFRNSQMYDTLMQMGRWFGYRDGYGDLVRVWLTDEAMHWYGHIAEASEELRAEMKIMHALRRTPRDFGLKVRAHPDTLIVTARNKMRTARTITRIISLSGEGPETPRLHDDAAVNAANLRAVKQFLKDLVDGRFVAEISERGNPLWRCVPATLVAKLLRRFDSHPLQLTFQPQQIAGFLEGGTVPAVAEWDVVIPNGRGDGHVIGGIALRLQTRKFSADRSTRSILISGSKARVASRGIEAEGLNREFLASLRAAWQAQHEDESMPDWFLRHRRERPLLLIHLVAPIPTERQRAPRISEHGDPAVALGLSFPKFDDSGSARRISYTVNTVEWQSLFEQEEDDDQLDEDLLSAAD